MQACSKTKDLMKVKSPTRDTTASQAIKNKNIKVMHYILLPSILTFIKFSINAGLINLSYYPAIKVSP